jgi:hypothetical protein
MAETFPGQSDSPVPSPIRGILHASLTERGMWQWWFARNRYLNGKSPYDAWNFEDGPRKVREAAHAFEAGFYV